MARRKYTREFKESAVRLVQQQGYSVAEAARSLGIDAGNIRGWLVKFGDDVGVPVAGSDEALRTENQRLRKENAQLLMEREILKKAATFFAKEQP
jgi:transposase